MYFANIKALISIALITISFTITTTISPNKTGNSLLNSSKLLLLFLATIKDL